jgi:predicted N-acetyltransferase YhbS
LVAAVAVVVTKLAAVVAVKLMIHIGLLAQRFQLLKQLLLVQTALVFLIITALMAVLVLLVQLPLASVAVLVALMVVQVLLAAPAVAVAVTRQPRLLVAVRQGLTHLRAVMVVVRQELEVLAVVVVHQQLVPMVLRQLVQMAVLVWLQYHSTQTWRQLIFQQLSQVRAHGHLVVVAVCKPLVHLVAVRLVQATAQGMMTTVALQQCTALAVAGQVVNLLALQAVSDFKGLLLSNMWRVQQVQAVVRKR